MQTRSLPGSRLLDGFARFLKHISEKEVNLTEVKCGCGGSKGFPWFNVICVLFECKDQSVSTFNTDEIQKIHITAEKQSLK